MPVLTKIKRPGTRRNLLLGEMLGKETFVFCPHCKAFQTVWVNGATLMPTRKFSQRDGRIYHDCGATQPCRLL